MEKKAKPEERLYMPPLAAIYTLKLEALANNCIKEAEDAKSLLKSSRI
jgi:hypothetical protein